MPKWGWLVLMILVSAAFLAACDQGDDDDNNDNDNDDDGSPTDDDDSSSACGDPIKDLYAAQCPENQNRCVGTDFEYRKDDEPFLAKRDFVTGDVEAMQFKFQAPYHLQKIKLHFKEGKGTARIHLYADYLGSVPKYIPWTDFIPTVELMTPVEVEVKKDGGWVTVDVTDQNLLFMPGTKVWVAYEHLSDDGLPLLYYSYADDPYYQCRYYTPDFYAQYGDRWGAIGRYYMIRLEGRHFCEREGDPYFTDVTTAAGIDVTGQHRTAWVDVDGDGLQDIVLTKLDTTNTPNNVFYYRNNGDGTFSNLTVESGLNQVSKSGVTLLADYDNDGDKDLISMVTIDVWASDDDDDDDDDNDDDNDTLALTESVKADDDTHNALFLNDGDGVFTEVTTTTGLEELSYYSSGGFGDYDNDGNLDLYVACWMTNYPYGPYYPDHLFHNEGDGTYADVTDAAGINDEIPLPSYGVTWVDFNNDGRYDVMSCNYGGNDNYVWENQGDGTFKDVARDKNLQRSYPYGGAINFGADFGDYNNDGNLDYIQSAIAHPRYQPSTGTSAFKISGGAPDYVYEDKTDAAGYVPDEGDVDPSFVDYNNDGRLDLFMSSLYSGHYPRLYEQQADGTLADITYWAGVEVHAGTGNAWGDFDGDGDMDLLESFNGDGGGVRLFRNEIGNQNNWLEVKLVGVNANHDAIGARITVTAGDLTQVRYVQGPRGHFGATPMFTQHFGLAQEAVADTIEVQWPGGETETWTGVNADQLIVLTEGSPDVQ
ncbi:MAG: CRTAC1 family protein [Myxococcales bacterium]|nr:CRTAC1 family protein [Myxococcales bacterium]